MSRRAIRWRQRARAKEWYRVLYNEKTCYVRKSIVCDNALIDAFQDVRDEVTISQNVNVRSMPKATRAVPTT